MLKEVNFKIIITAPGKIFEEDIHNVCFWLYRQYTLRGTVLEDVNTP